jgi:hypothetical protein
LTKIKSNTSCLPYDDFRQNAWVSTMQLKRHNPAFRYGVYQPEEVSFLRGAVLRNCNADLTGTQLEAIARDVLSAYMQGIIRYEELANVVRMRSSTLAAAAGQQAPLPPAVSAAGSEVAGLGEGKADNSSPTGQGRAAGGSVNTSKRLSSPDSWSGFEENMVGVV